MKNYFHLHPTQCVIHIGVLKNVAIISQQFVRNYIMFHPIIRVIIQRMNLVQVHMIKLVCCLVYNIDEVF